MNVSQMQSMLAMNAAVITKQHAMISTFKRILKLAVHTSVVNRCLKNIYKRTIIVKRLSLLQRSLKDDVKAARTSKRVYRKHAKIVAQEMCVENLVVA